MFMIEIAGVKVLYTGDFSRVEDRHLMAAEIPSVTPDILITVSWKRRRRRGGRGSMEGGKGRVTLILRGVDWRHMMAAEISSGGREGTEGGKRGRWEGVGGRGEEREGREQKGEKGGGKGWERVREVVHLFNANTPISLVLMLLCMATLDLLSWQHRAHLYYCHGNTCIQEATYGTHVNEQREVREMRFTSKCCVFCGGCLGE